MIARQSAISIYIVVTSLYLADTCCKSLQRLVHSCSSRSMRHRSLCRVHVIHDWRCFDSEASSSASPSQPRTSSSPELQAMRACRRFHQGYDTSRNSLLAFQPSKTCISAAGASTCDMHVFSDPCLWVENTYNLLARVSEPDLTQVPLMIGMTKINPEASSR